MKDENVLNYWIEAVESALEEIDKLSYFSNKEIKTLAETLCISSEQQSLAFGYEHIPNPLEAEIIKIKSEYNHKIEILERNDLIYRKNVANRHGINAENVYIKDEIVMYDLR